MNRKALRVFSNKPQYHPLKRALQKHVEDELSEALIQGDVTEESTVEVFCSGERLAFREVLAKKPEKQLTQKA